MNKHQVGNYGEERAVWFLTRKGYQILGRNYRCRQGEVDIIAKDGPYLVFIEVKYRKSGRCGDPAEAVGGTKQKRLYQAARHYLCRHGCGVRGWAGAVHGGCFWMVSCAGGLAFRLFVLWMNCTEWIFRE